MELDHIHPTPVGVLTPTSLRRYGDRFIPIRAGNTWGLSFPSCSTPTTSAIKESINTSSARSTPNRSSTYSRLLLNETLGYEENESKLGPKQPVTPNRKLFHYDATEPFNNSNSPSSFSSSPLSLKSEELLLRPQKVLPPRHISQAAFKMLDAPGLRDDFYLNLLDWSTKNEVCVGLDTCVYIWTPETGKVLCLCDLQPLNDVVTSIGWKEDASILSVGTHGGDVQLWDPVAEKLLSTYHGHAARVGAIAWNGSQISTGSRDGTINQWDTREDPSLFPNWPVDLGDMHLSSIEAHRGEVCGLKWSHDKLYLASGGNDNRVRIWSNHSRKAVQTYREHTAGVKALAWSPHRHGLLASGGGTADKQIRFVDTLTGRPMQNVDTGSQVCNLAWSKYDDELVSTHGYSENEIVIWKYPTMEKVVKLTGHTCRVVYMAMSPEGEVVITGAGGEDQSLRFWKVFKKTRRQTGLGGMSQLSLFRKL